MTYDRVHTSTLCYCLCVHVFDCAYARLSLVHLWTYELGVD